MTDTINVHDGSAGYHPQLYDDHLDILCVQRMLDPTTISKDELEKVQKYAKNSACEEYFLCLFILVSEYVRFQGLNRDLDNHFLLDNDAYPTTMPQALKLKLLGKFKAEVGKTPKGRADYGEETGVAFAQAQSCSHSMVFHNCGVKGYRVNECPNLNHAQRKQFWDDRNNARREKANTAPKEGTAHAAVDKDNNPKEDDAARVKYKCYQHIMREMEELDIGMVQLGHSDTGVVE